MILYDKGLSQKWYCDNFILNVLLLSEIITNGVKKTDILQ